MSQEFTFFKNVAMKNLTPKTYDVFGKTEHEQS